MDKNAASTYISELAALLCFYARNNTTIDLLFMLNLHMPIGKHFNSVVSQYICSYYKITGKLIFYLIRSTTVPNRRT